MAERSQTATKIPFEAPVTMTVGLLQSTGQFQNAYPTVSISYIGLSVDKCPDSDQLTEIQAFALNFSKDEDANVGEIELLAFLQPKKELLDFAETRYLCGEVPLQETSRILRKAAELERYVVIVSTDYYHYRALVDDTTGEVMEASTEYRLLN